MTKGCFFLIIFMCHFSLTSQIIVVDSTLPYSPVFKIENKVSLSKTLDSIKKFFKVKMKTESDINIALSGRYFNEDSFVCFRPFAVLDPGLTFEISFNNIQKKIYRTPSKIHIPNETKVKSVYPKEDTIAQNILLFYLEFSETMNEDILAFKNVFIKNEKGDTLKEVWRHKSYWINGNILALMIHPARVKSGIDNFDELGKLFEKNKLYTLFVSPDMKNENNQKLVQKFEYNFRISESIREKIVMLHIDTLTLKQNSLSPIKLTFNSAIDYGSLIEGVSLQCKNEGSVEIKIVRGKSDRIWWIYPTENWKKENYKLVLNKMVSDVCGNHLHRTFEIKSLDEMNEINSNQIYFFTPQ